MGYSLAALGIGRDEMFAAFDAMPERQFDTR
jgi:hypothetical protein